jgi:tetratricopeptide (TPR) repeat protein
MTSIADLLNRSRKLLEEGQFVQAQDLCHQILQVHPAESDAAQVLGAAYHLQGKIAEAIACYQRAVRLNPDHFLARLNLAVAQLQQGQLADAEANIRWALRLRPEHAEAHNCLGNILVQQRKPDAALASYEKTLRLDPRHADAHNNLANVLRQRARLEEALDHYEASLRLKPASAITQKNAGAVLAELERYDEARQHLQEALRLKPDYGVAYFQLGELARRGQFSFDAGSVERMEKLAADPGRKPEDRSQIHFTLGDTFDRQGDYDGAFAHYHQGNAIRRELLRQQKLLFDAEQYRHVTDQAIQLFTPDYFECVQPLGIDTELPIFIVGMPRSGTSLVEQVLSSHPLVQGAGELPDITLMVQELPAVLGAPEGYPNCLARLDGATAGLLGERYLSRLRDLGGPALRVTDKMPANYFHIGLILTLFPRVRIVHCRRHPLDVCLSCYQQNFMEVAFASDLRDLGLYYGQYERLMAHWMQVVPESICEVPYEEFVNNQKALSRKLIKFCGLDWDDRCLEFHKNARIVRTASKLQVRQPLYKTSIGRWRRYRTHLGSLIDALGWQDSAVGH